MPELPFTTRAPRARVVRCPLTGREALHIRCGSKEVEVRGAADPHVLAATINQQLARIRTS